MSKPNIFVGLKIGPASNAEYLNQISEHVDFVEVYAAPGSYYEYLTSFPKPVVVHVAHFGNGVNFANPQRSRQNEAALKHALHLADKFSASKVIFHPELKEDESCTLEVLADFIKRHYDERLHLESMPFSSMGFEHFAASLEEIRYLLDKLQVKLCLDLAHTTEYLARQNLPLDKVHDYFALQPNHFHITDTILSKVFEHDYNEEHINFGEGDIEVSRYKNLLPKGCSITIETPTNLEKQLQEIQLFR